MKAYRAIFPLAAICRGPRVSVVGAAAVPGDSVSSACGQAAAPAEGEDPGFVPGLDGALRRQGWQRGVSPQVPDGGRL